MALSKLDYLTAMGIQCWQVKQPPPPPAAFDQACLYTVVGEGNLHADVMFISDALDFYEDQQREFFTDQADRLFHAMLRAIGLQAEAVYRAAFFKCRLPDHQSVLSDVANQCSALLDKHITLVQPKVLLVLGQAAAHYLLNIQTPLEQMRGTLHSYGARAIPLLATYPLAHLLLHPQDKRKAWKDLQLILGRQ